MSETLFGTTGVQLKEQFDSPKVVAEAHSLIGNLYGLICQDPKEERQLFGFLKEIHGITGPLQGNMDNMKADSVESYDHFETETHFNGNEIPKGTAMLAEGSAENPEQVKQEIQQQMRENLGEDAENQPHGPKETVESTEDVRETLLDAPDMGEQRLEKLADYMENNGIESISFTADDLRESDDSYDALSDVPPAELAEMSQEQIAALQEATA